MVKYIKQSALILSLLLLAAQAAFAASFTATVDRTEVAPGEGFNLNLSLSDASPDGNPDFSPLEDDFTIYSQGESHQTTIINTHFSSSIIWQLVLIPKKTGNLTIPAISVKTDSGVLRSDPVNISVTKSAGISPDGGADNRALLVTTEVSKAEPYQNEPILYTVKLIARKNVRDINIPEFNVDGAIVEKQGDAKIYDGVLQGQPAKVVELRYLITPLKSGTMNIPAFVFQGQVQSGRGQEDFFSRRMHDALGKFDDFADFPGFASFEPFSLSGQEITLDVKPPAVSMEHWLPLTSLKLSDDLEGADSAKVGEPLTRKLKMVAEGASGAILPDLENIVAPKDSFRIYADKPSSGEKISRNGDTITGWREESFTLIPQKSGEVSLPEIKVPWWDVKNDKISYATVPARMINIKPGRVPAQDQTGTQGLSQAQVKEQAQTTGQELSSNSRNTGEGIGHTPIFQNSILISLVLVVIILTGTVLYLFRKLSQQKKLGTVTVGKMTGSDSLSDAATKVSLRDLNKSETPEDLRDFLQAYAYQHWEMQRNASLRAILSFLKEHGVQTDMSETKRVFYDLDAALYAGEKINIMEIKHHLAGVIKAADGKHTRSERQRENLGSINPT